MTNTSQGKWEPNLVPMLDMVLQMVMFFMLCANFAQAELSEKVKLPLAIEARSLDRLSDRVIFVNLLIVKDDKTGAKRWKALIHQDEETNALRVQKNLEGKLALYKEGRKGKAGADKAPLVILRADQECEWKMVHEVMAACRRAGYADVQLR